MDSLKDFTIMTAIQATTGMLPAVLWVMMKLGVGAKALTLHLQLTEEKTRQRVALGSGRADFMDGLIQSDMPFKDVEGTGGLLIIAGSETSATLLTGAMFFLTTHPDVLDKLTAEVRAQFHDESEITLDGTNGLQYMLAVLNETARCYPPVAISSPRVVPPEGAVVAGHAIPSGTVVSVWQWATYHDPGLFTDPDRFDPERFLHQGAGKYANDRMEAFNPFLLGPRNCIGQRLAYAEMRLILARIIWAFDVSISDESRGWLQGQEYYQLWDKPPLWIHLTPVAH
jgi:cytochrome P450